MKRKKASIMPGKDSSKAKRIVKAATTLILFIALLFVPAGTLKWTEAWLFIILYLSVVTGVVIWLKKNDPGLLEERMTVKKDAKRWDKNIIRTYSLLVMILLAVTGLDAVRFHWSRVPLALKVLGFLGFIPMAVVGIWAMKENPYLSQIVRIQDERGHKVCTTGPYRYVRHPMYAGVILFILCFPLALGSLYALIPSLMIIILFMFRTSLEDKTLHKELSGYREYAKKVRYKLIPGVW
jgi:protein-S-isoprenylcysteine O-methyltransferase Ste14